VGFAGTMASCEGIGFLERHRTGLFLEQTQKFALLKNGRKRNFLQTFRQVKSWTKFLDKLLTSADRSEYITISLPGKMSSIWYEKKATTLTAMPYFHASKKDQTK
jgi:hypothetical protein